MGVISANTGLSSGINITGTIQKLMAIDSQPVTTLQNTDTTLTNEETAIAQLSALLLSVQDATHTLGQTSTYGSQTATSSDTSALAATVTGTPTAGTYVYTPLQTAQSQQLLSSGFASDTSALGGGTFTFGYGSTVAQGASLAEINGGQGLAPGEIRITDRSGASAVINLSNAQNINDVVQDINGAGTINVTASTDDGHIVLTDNTGDTASNLQVQEVDGGTTAASLGLSGIDVAASSAAGENILALSNNLSLNVLHDGAGVQTNSSALGDINYTLHDGTSGTINLSGQTTLGGVIQAVSSQSDGKLQVSIAPSGTSLVIDDTTAAANPSGTLSISNQTGSTAASDLGLVVNNASAGTVTGTQILGGLNTVLLSDLNGGQGLGPLGYIKLADGNGNSVNVNLAGAATLQDVINDINGQIEAQNGAEPSGQAVGITAEVNAAGNGIQLVDTSGGSGALTAANSDSADDGGSDGLDTAVKLGFATASAPGSSSTGVLNSGDLHLRTVSQNTLLSSYNGGAGVAAGSFQITDSAGSVSTIQVTSSDHTIGDVINAINRGTSGVHAAINSTGDGIVLTDTANGSGTLTVTEGDSTTAADLNLLTPEAAVDGVQTINGSTTRTITLQAGDTLTDLENDINNLNAGLSASIVSDGSSNPYRLSLTATQSGQAGNLVVDGSGIAGLSLQELAQGQNALLALGNASAVSGASNSSAIVSSSTNTFSNVLPGVSLQVNSATGQTVSVTVGNDGTNISSSLQSFVTNYNNFASQLTTGTAYNTTTETGAVLSDDPTALALDVQLSQLLTTQYVASGPVQSLADVGITVQSDGTLSFNQNQFDSAWASNPAAVQQLFTAATTGVSAQFDNLINQLAGQNNNSLLSSRSTALQTEIGDNQASINQMNQMLNDQQNTLYTDFYNMDLTIGKLKNTQSLISSLSIISPDFGANTSSSATS
jgi:flagellar hook-associated protein 2